MFNVIESLVIADWINQPVIKTMVSGLNQI
jgi:hypothetical protein